MRHGYVGATLLAGSMTKWRHDSESALGVIRAAAEAAQAAEAAVQAQAAQVSTIHDAEEKAKEDAEDDALRKAAEQVSYVPTATAEAATAEAATAEAADAAAIAADPEADAAAAAAAEAEAATRIAAIHRGNLERRSVLLKQQEELMRELEALENEEMDEAASKIAATYRGNKARSVLVEAAEAGVDDLGKAVAAKVSIPPPAAPEHPAVTEQSAVTSPVDEPADASKAPEAETALADGRLPPLSPAGADGAAAAADITDQAPAAETAVTEAAAGEAASAVAADPDASADDATASDRQKQLAEIQRVAEIHRKVCARHHARPRPLYTAPTTLCPCFVFGLTHPLHPLPTAPPIASPSPPIATPSPRCNPSQA